MLLNGNAISAEIELGPNDWLSYTVVNASDTVNDFFGSFPPGTYFGNWSVLSGDEMNFNVTSVTEDTINGTLFIGNELDNVTFTDVRNIDTSFGLGLGIYPWSGGFFADSSDWDGISTLIQGTNTTVTSIGCYEYTFEKEQTTISVIHFNTTNYYGQFSSFYYHKATGILLKAYTSFGLYELEITLNVTNLNLETQNCAETSTTNTFLISFILFSVIYLIKKKTK